MIIKGRMVNYRSIFLSLRTKKKYLFTYLLESQIYVNICIKIHASLKAQNEINSSRGQTLLIQKRVVEETFLGLIGFGKP